MEKELQRHNEVMTKINNAVYLSELPKVSKANITGCRANTAMKFLVPLKVKAPRACPPSDWATKATPQINAVNSNNNRFLVSRFIFSSELKSQLS